MCMFLFKSNFYIFFYIFAGATEERHFLHYENAPMQYTAFFHGCKNDNFQIKKLIIFLFLLKTLIVGTR